MITTNQQTIKRSKEEYILLALCVAGVVGVVPFAFIRYMNAQWLAGTIDTVLVIGVIVVGLYVWKTRLIRVASVILTLFYMSAMVMAIYVSGPLLTYWAFPTMMAAYFLVKPKEAALINIVATALVMPGLLPNLEVVVFSSFLMTLILSNIFAYIFSSQMQKQHDELVQLATIDPLTGIYNRRLFDERIRETVALRKRHHEVSSLISLDIDHFKEINDTFGHAKGDEVLIKLARLLSTRLRESDSVFRIGGEEFSILLKSTNAADAMKFAEDLRVQVEKCGPLMEYSVTISLGAAECYETDSAESWLKRADAGLYQAKNTGRNKTCLAQVSI